MERSWLRPTIVRSNSNENVFVFRLCVFNKNVEVAILVEDSCIEEFELGLRAATALVFIHKPAVRKFGLRIFVQRFHVAMSRRGIEVEVILLYVFAVIAFVACKPKNALLQDGIAAIPKSEREADHLMAIADTGDSVFSPAVGT